MGSWLCVVATVFLRNILATDRHGLNTDVKSGGRTLGFDAFTSELAAASLIREVACPRGRGFICGLISVPPWQLNTVAINKNGMEHRSKDSMRTLRDENVSR